MSGSEQRIMHQCHRDERDGIEDLTDENIRKKYKSITDLK